MSTRNRFEVQSLPVALEAPMLLRCRYPHDFQPKQDVANHPAVAEELNMTGRADQDLRNGVVYVLNTAFERKLRKIPTQL